MKSRTLNVRHNIAALCPVLCFFLTRAILNVLILGVAFLRIKRKKKSSVMQLPANKLYSIATVLLVRLRKSFRLVIIAIAFAGMLPPY